MKDVAMVPCSGVVKVNTLLGDKVFFLTHIWVWQNNVWKNEVEKVLCVDNEGVEHTFKYEEEPFEIFYCATELIL